MEVNVDIENGSSIFCIEIFVKLKWKIVGSYYDSELKANDDFKILVERNPKKRYRLVEIYFEPRRMVIR